MEVNIHHAGSHRSKLIAPRRVGERSYRAWTLVRVRSTKLCPLCKAAFRQRTCSALEWDRACPLEEQLAPRTMPRGKWGTVSRLGSGGMHVFSGCGPGRSRQRSSGRRSSEFLGSLCRGGRQTEVAAGHIRFPDGVLDAWRAGCVGLCGGGGGWVLGGLCLRRSNGWGVA